MSSQLLASLNLPTIKGKGDTNDSAQSIYTWKQEGAALVQVFIKLAQPDIEAEDVYCEIHSNRIKAGMLGQAPLVNIELFGAVDKKASSWDIDNSDDSSSATSSIVISLTKKSPTAWPSLSAPRSPSPYTKLIAENRTSKGSEGIEKLKSMWNSDISSLDKKLQREHSLVRTPTNTSKERTPKRPRNLQGRRSITSSSAAPGQSPNGTSRKRNDRSLYCEIFGTEWSEEEGETEGEVDGETEGDDNEDTLTGTEGDNTATDGDDDIQQEGPGGQSYESSFMKLLSKEFLEKQLERYKEALEMEKSVTKMANEARMRLEEELMETKLLLEEEKRKAFSLKNEKEALEKHVSELVDEIDAETSSMKRMKEMFVSESQKDKQEKDKEKEKEREKAKKTKQKKTHKVESEEESDEEYLVQQGRAKQKRGNDEGRRNSEIAEETQYHTYLLKEEIARLKEEVHIKDEMAQHMSDKVEGMLSQFRGFVNEVQERELKRLAMERERIQKKEADKREKRVQKDEQRRRDEEAREKRDADREERERKRESERQKRRAERKDKEEEIELKRRQQKLLEEENAIEKRKEKRKAQKLDLDKKEKELEKKAKVVDRSKSLPSPNSLLHLLQTGSSPISPRVLPPTLSPFSDADASRRISMPAALRVLDSSLFL